MCSNLKTYNSIDSEQLWTHKNRASAAVTNRNAHLLFSREKWKLQENSRCDHSFVKAPDRPFQLIWNWRACTAERNKNIPKGRCALEQGNGNAERNANRIAKHEESSSCYAIHLRGWNEIPGRMTITISFHCVLARALCVRLFRISPNYIAAAAAAAKRREINYSSVKGKRYQLRSLSDSSSMISVFSGTELFLSYNQRLLVPKLLIFEITGNIEALKLGDRFFNIILEWFPIQAKLLFSPFRYYI